MRSLRSYCLWCLVQHTPTSKHQSDGVVGAVQVLNVLGQRLARGVAHPHQFPLLVAQLGETVVESDEEFVLVLSRRRIGGGHGYEPVAAIDDSGMLEQAIRKATS